MGDDSGEKTEEPTPHKLREARKKGQIAKSKEITTSIMVIVSFYVLKSSATFIWENMTSISRNVYLHIPLEFSASIVGHLLKETLFVFLMSLGPLMAANFLVAIVIEAAQTGFLVSVESIKPKFSKLNPIEGFKKYVSLKQYVELLKSVIKMAIVISLLYGIIKKEFYMVLISQHISLYQVVEFTANLVMQVVTQVGLFYFIIAIFDYMYQKYEHIKGLRMSKKEIKDEYKQLEGDPTVKQRQKEAARQLSQGRQMGAVPSSDVVVTNPVHVAIAISYDPNVGDTPIVVAKGQRLIAESIKSLAKEHSVPVIESPPLARELFKYSELNFPIPPNYYKAVAEILAFVYNLKKKKQKRT